MAVPGNDVHQERGLTLIKYGYHRTDISNVASIVENGFRPGWGSMYGKGWYMCYDLDSQIGRGMEHYGDALIKSRIYEKNIIIFDYNISKKYYGSKYSVIDQLILNRFYSGKEFIPAPWVEISQACELSLLDPRYSATVAYHCFVSDVKGSAVIRTKSLDPSVKKSDHWGVSSVGLKPNSYLPRIGKLTGIIFTGNHDGNVYVCYDPKSAIPEEYAIVDSSVTSKDDIEWKPVSEFKQDTLKSNQSITEIVYEKYPDIETFDIDTEYFKKLNFNSDALFRQFQWFFKAKKKKAKVYIEADGHLYMQGGTWLMGTWEDGTFRDAIWNAGVWKQGTFTNAEWRAGNFLSGTFTGSTFKNGQFKGGRFIDSVFENGTYSADPHDFDWSSTWKRGSVVVNGKTYIPKTNNLQAWAQEQGI